MLNSFINDEQIEDEILRLAESDAVKLAQVEQAINSKRKQLISEFHKLEKRGEQLLSEGYTLENIEEKMMGAFDVFSSNYDY